MKLLQEFRSQFSAKEWLDAMKQAIKEIFNQWSIKEWVHAFFVYIPTAHAPRIKGGARLTQLGRANTFNEYGSNLRNEIAR